MVIVLSICSTSSEPSFLRHCVGNTITEIIDHGKAFLIETEDQLEEALSSTENIYSKELCMLDVRLDRHDGSPALQRLTESLGKKVR